VRLSLYLTWFQSVCTLKKKEISASLFFIVSSKKYLVNFNFRKIAQFLHRVHPGSRESSGQIWMEKYLEASLNTLLETINISLLRFIYFCCVAGHWHGACNVFFFVITETIFWQSTVHTDYIKAFRKRFISNLVFHFLLFKTCKSLFLYLTRFNGITSFFIKGSHGCWWAACF